MGRKSISHSTYHYDANFLYPMSYVYDPTDTKTETKEEIWLKITNLESRQAKICNKILICHKFDSKG